MGLKVQGKVGNKHVREKVRLRTLSLSSRRRGDVGIDIVPRLLSRERDGD